MPLTQPRPEASFLPPPRDTRVAAGGPVADLHEMIAARLSQADAARQALAIHTLPVEERMISGFSRLAGPTALASAIALIGWWLLPILS